MAGIWKQDDWSGVAGDLKVSGHFRSAFTSRRM